MKSSLEDIEAALNEYWKDSAEIRRRYAKYMNDASITLAEAKQHVIDLD